MYLRILGYLKAHGWVFGAAVFATFIFAFLDAFSFLLVIPFLRVLFTDRDGPAPESVSVGDDTLDRILNGTVGRMVDLDAPPQQAIYGIIFFILGVFALKNVFDFLKVYLMARVQQGVTRDLRDRVYDHLVDLDMAFFGRTKMGQILSRLTYDVEQLRVLVAKELGRVVSSVFEFAATVVAAVVISWQLTLAAFVVVPFTMGIWGPLIRKLKRNDRKVLSSAADVNAHIQETLSGIRLVKSSSTEDYERERFHNLTLRYYTRFLRSEKLRALASPITEMLSAIGTVILLWFGARLVLVSGSLTGEEFIGFLALSMKLYSPVKYLAKFPALIQPGLVGAERIFEFLDAPIEVEEADDSRPFPGLHEEVSFNGVGFEYRSGEPVLQGVSFTVPRGSVVALVGPSGAGKTTILDLLSRFYDVTEGSISVDGIDIRDFTVRGLRSSLGIVSQETILFHDTVRANIAYGSSDSTQEEVERAAEAAHAHGFISDLPKGYETVVGERGTELSGGQRQRLAIARAILRNPPILVFDEATSSLDTEAERLVQQAIERLLEGRTVFVIAHRLSTVQRADQILVLDKGRIVERGTHQELVSADGLYRRLYELQFSDEAMDFEEHAAGREEDLAQDLSAGP
ncbi:MAG: ABC transporter ATP-binding protein [Gemmatimonadetes bacterium]|nr:ABC transporter ATP-binding protein [Gemmatimonadota bacterium]